MRQPAAQSRSKGLSAAFVHHVTEPGKHHDGSGIGLYLRVEKTGGKFWVQRITIAGKRREIGLGSPPVVTLAMAREKALKNKRAIYERRDPLAEKHKARASLNFAEAVDRYLEGKLAEFRNEKHQKQWRSTLSNYAGPVLGPMHVDTIETADVLRVLQPIWSEKTETALRLRGRIEAVLSWATVTGHRTGDNPARWKGNLSELLPKPQRAARTTHQPAVALDDLPRWWRALEKRQGMSARALQFLALTAARSGEVRGAIWDEIDLEKKLWTIPAERMKSGREHKVPLPEAAVDLFRGLPRMEGSAYVFFGPRGGMLSDVALSKVMRRMHNADLKAGGSGYFDRRSKRPAVPHGLRSSFRDWAAEAGVDHIMAELCLAHVIGNTSERAYRRTDLVKKRRGVLSRWGDFMRGECGEVVSFGA